MLSALLSVFIVSAQKKVQLIDLPNSAQFNSLDTRFKSGLIADNLGKIWLSFSGTKSGTSFIVSKVGLACYYNGAWTMYNSSNTNLPSNYITGICQKGNDIWLSSNKGIARFNNGSFDLYNTQNGKAPIDSFLDMKSANNIIWLRTATSVYRFDGTNWTEYNSQNSPMINNTITGMDVGADGKVWIVGVLGVNSFDGTTWKSFKANNSNLTNDDIKYVTVDKNNVAWVAASSSVYFDGKAYHAIYKIENDQVINILDLPYPSCEAFLDLYAPINELWAGPDGYVYTSYNSSQLGENAVSEIIRLNSASQRRYTISEWFYNATIAIPRTGILFAKTASQNKLYYVAAKGINTDKLFFINLDEYQAPVLKFNNKLDINEVSTPVFPGSYFGSEQTSGGYSVPKRSCKNALLAGSLWIGGLHNNQLHLATQTYRQGGSDFYSGPIASGNIGKNVDSSFLKVWKINRWDIENFKKNFADGNVTNGTYKVLPDFITWPAKGDTLRGQLKNMAPFTDVNGDGNYNPMQGDYPKIKGDQMLFWIFNDSSNAHAQSGGARLGVEIHGSAYAFICDQFASPHPDEALNHTTFYHYRIINRSNRNYDSLKTAFWIDSDLGNYVDDLLGSNPQESYGYVYNANPIDAGVTGYGIAPPALAVVMLNNGANEKADGFLHYDNDMGPYGFPSATSDFWNYMNSRWKDGTPVTYGASGKNGTDPAKFMYPGSLDPQGRPNWFDPINGDKQYILYSKPGSLPAKQEMEVNMAIVYSRLMDTIGWPQNILGKLDADVKKVKGWYAAQQYPSCLKLNLSAPANEIPANSYGLALQIIPNPAHSFVILNNVQSSSNYAVFDISGKKILSGKYEAGNQIDITSLPVGMYIIQLQNTTGTIFGKMLRQ